MFNRLKTLYKDELLTKEMLERAVEKKWITEEQKQQIIESVA